MVFLSLPENHPILNGLVQRGPINKAKTQAILLADEFTDRAQQTKVLAAAHQIMSSDFNVSTWESTLLSELRMKFRM